MSASSEPYLRAKSFANCSPISRIPSPKISRHSSRFFDAAMEDTRLSALLSLKLSSFITSSRVSEYMSAGSFTPSVSTSLSTADATRATKTAVLSSTPTI